MADGKEYSSSVQDDGKHIVRLRGLPWQVKNEDIFEFFKGINVVPGGDGILIASTASGRPTGEAFVQFQTAEDCAEALKRDRQSISWRYIEVYQSSEAEREKAKSRSRPGGSWSGPISHLSSVVRMRGLPFSATEDQIRSFFTELEVAGVHILMDHLGRPSGEAFVEFPSEELQRRAMNEYNRKYMASRYIEIFKSDVGEMTALMSRASRGYEREERERGRGRGPPPRRDRDYYDAPPSRRRGPPVDLESTTCVRMQGIPFEATEDDITRFFQEASVTPLRIHRQEQGGEAYVEFSSSQDARQAMTKHKANIGRRYIELFRVSYDELADIVGLPPRHAGGYGPPGGGYAPYNPYGASYDSYDYPPPDPYYRDRDYRDRRRDYR